MSERLKQIKENYTNMIDIALSQSETLSEHEIDVSDLKWLIKQAELVEELENKNADLSYELGKHKRALEKKHIKNQRYREVLESIAYSQFNVEPKRVVVKMQSKARQALEGDKL
ncbi:hypothetical protein ACTWQB_14750 [Piscibacillus sp. B03]|uniref:hypothetical protein n=1 Tax=Piscibacillus sp. B03 TaxID=3457430 RepID=UPI003FCC316F